MSGGTDDQEERGPVGEQVRGEQEPLVCPICSRPVRTVLLGMRTGTDGRPREIIIRFCPYCDVD